MLLDRDKRINELETIKAEEQGLNNTIQGNSDSMVIILMRVSCERPLTRDQSRVRMDENAYPKVDTSLGVLHEM